MSAPQQTCLPLVLVDSSSRAFHGLGLRNTDLASSIFQKTYPSLLITCLRYWTTSCNKNLLTTRKTVHRKTTNTSPCHKQKEHFTATWPKNMLRCTLVLCTKNLVEKICQCPTTQKKQMLYNTVYYKSYQNQ